MFFKRVFGFTLYYLTGHFISFIVVSGLFVCWKVVFFLSEFQKNELFFGENKLENIFQCLVM
jgi:hypothetical protein